MPRVCPRLRRRVSPAQSLLGKAGTEEVGGQLVRPPPVQNGLTPLEALPRCDVPCRFPHIQSAIAMVLEYRKVAAAHDADIVRSCCQCGISVGYLARRKIARCSAVRPVTTSLS